LASLRSNPALVFIGFMGAGKTAAARSVGEALAEPHVDADEAFFEAHGTLPGAYIDEHGEDAFRFAEEELVLGLLERGPGVIALGGGAIETPGVRDALAAHVVVWCRVGPDEAWERVALDPAEWRPLAADRAAFVERFERRRPIYESVATAVLPEGEEGMAARAAPFLAALRELSGARLAWAASASGEYPVFVGSGLLDASPLGKAARHGDIGLSGDRAFLVTDSTVGSLYGDRLRHVAGRVEVPAGEQSKTLAEAERVLRELADAGMTRSDHLLALGGGVVGDLAGFCAATYQRGVGLVHVPTTLVAQVDSAYGGKTGVDLPEAKNYVGAYHLPKAVLADPDTLQTLPAAELAAGFAEVLKTGLLAGGSLWDQVTALRPGEPVPADVIFACALTKLDVVAADERDAGVRASLNLGHTVGHAIEAASGYGRYRHGEAVGLGLLAALRLSDAQELRNEVREHLGAWNLPTALDPGVATDDVLAAVARDKKRGAEGVGFVLLERPGEPQIGRLVAPDRVRAAVDELR
jgi:shikimate kinase / 3-dehydroquinate synthase